MLSSYDFINTVYNIFGQEVKTIINEFQSAGFYRVTWDGRDNLGNNVRSGIYINKLQSAGQLHKKNNFGSINLGILTI